MTLIVETGSGVAGAESFASVEDALAYHSNRGNDIWATITTLQQEQALRRATDYMGAYYRPRWKGRRVSPTQSLDWPRVGVVLDEFNDSVALSGLGYYGVIVVPFNSVPVNVVNACCEFALKAAAGELAPDLDRETTSESVGGISVSYRAGAPQHIRFRALDLLLAPFLANASAVLVRA
jgi:hypothetical protein